MMNEREECKCCKAEQTMSPCRSGECYHFTCGRKGAICMNCNNTGYQLSEEEVQKNRVRWHKQNQPKRTFTQNQVEACLEEIEKEITTIDHSKIKVVFISAVRSAFDKLLK